MLQLKRLGAEVGVLPFVHGAFDSVFAKDAAVLVRRGREERGMMAHPLHPERRAEQRARREALEARGFHVTSPPPTTLEGGDVVVGSRKASRGQRAYLGYGFRSSRNSVEALERFLEMPVTPLELRDPRLYHLDMALAVLGNTLLVCEEALAPAAMRELERCAGSDALVRVSLEEASHFALNFIQIGDDVILAKGVPSFEGRLRSLGYRTHGVGLTEFHLAGGSAGCLVARVHEMGGCSE